MTSLTVPARAVVQATPRTRIITADLRGHQFWFTAGQAVFAGLADSSVRRPYSIACSPQQAEKASAIELLVQIDDHAAPDPHLERVAPGTALHVEGPFGSLALPSRVRERDLLLVAGGTGIAPLRAIMWDTFERQPDLRITVAYSARSPQEFAFLDELQALQRQGRIDLALTVTRDSQLPWTGSRGRISQAFIEAALKGRDTLCLICGPATLTADARILLKSAGISDGKIVTV